MQETNTQAKKKSPKASLALGLLYGVATFVSLHIFHQKGEGLLSGLLKENYIHLWVCGTIALAAFTGGLIRRKKALGFVLFFLGFFFLALQLIKTDIPIYLVSFLAEVFGLLPLAVGKLFAILAGLAPLPAWFSLGAEWAAGGLSALLFWYLPALFSA